MRPMTPSSLAIAFVAALMSSRISAPRVGGGRMQAESPEWIPASSMCSMIPPITTRVPSLIASTSTSIASSRNLSTRMGRSGEASTAFCM